MEKLEPRRPEVYWNHLGRQLKLWRAYKITDAHALKLLKLWLGYEFTDLMDPFGRYPVQYFNEIRRRLGYAHWSVLLADLRSCRSFFLVGTSDENITAVFSPIWHEWEEADGTILAGSCDTKESQTLSQTFDVSKNINTKNNPTGSNDGALPRDVVVRRRIVSDYFKWLVRQPQSEQKALVENLRWRIANPTDHKGNALPQYALNSEQTDEVWDVMVENVFVPYFQTRDDFFRAAYMQHPENRIWWLTNLMKKWAAKSIVQARNIWRRRYRDIEAEKAQTLNELQMQYRPRSPYEWETPDGTRWYETAKGGKQQIPAEAEPRPSEKAEFNYMKNQWGGEAHP